MTILWILLGWFVISGLYAWANWSERISSKYWWIIEIMILFPAFLVTWIFALTQAKRENYFDSSSFEEDNNDET